MSETRAKTVKGRVIKRKRNRAVQTVNSNVSTDLAKLQKQIELLQLENDTLRKQVQATKASNAVHVSSNNKAQKISKIKITICGCKTDCSSKRCSCVKKNNKCTASCQCSSNVCQNQDLEDQSDESDQEESDQEESDQEESGQEESDQEESDKENTLMNGTATPQKQGLTQNKIGVRKKENNLASDKIINHMEEQFDPMKPRHQLSRTPPRKHKTVNEKIHVDNPHQCEIEKRDLPPSPQIMGLSFNIKEEHSNMENDVDWMQHTAQLIPCKKCNRTFMPHRIKKHEACCKRI